MKQTCLVLLLSLGCSMADRGRPPELHGAPLPAAVPRPAFTLTSTKGQAFDFARATRGRLTLLFFGYTSCPDVCPATMSILGAVANRMTSEERKQIDIVFVTTDPDRDRPEVLEKWLSGFDRDMIGLTGTIEEVEAAQKAAGVAVAIREPGSAYTVSHAAQVLVYTPDDSGHVAYPFGTRQADWNDDMPKLLAWRGSSR